ncbi:hypothetical protein CC86DRAFT_337458 [Ophiobolus disseminans]|uniref:LysM domain-containing protein n=1 Tax=Ophiobolus disseminans TaxID=1469910 RepID=A0A6A6ZD25_9PLEO|nr:hypothetical protein CC86DRAFT_337458 [Ophiobolus disseminans]
MKFATPIILFVSSGVFARSVIRRQNGPIDPSTTKNCNWYDDAKTASENCAYFEDFWGISHADFVKWNPSVKNDCSGIVIGNSYCIEVLPPPPATVTSSSSSTTPTPTKIVKPSPTQDGLVDSCTNFYFAVKSDNCQKIANKYGTFSIADFIKWNPAVGPDCDGLWAQTYYCVGIPGTPTTPIATATATGTPKPSPTQEGLIDSCTSFYFAVKSDTCTKIVQKYGTFNVADFIKWNPAVGADCGGLWAETYYCVGVPGTPTTPLPSSTSKPTGTGTPKPQPTQDGLISSCTNFYFAVKDDTCAKIVKQYGTFSLRDFITWNPAVGSDCTSLWAQTYYCVGIPGTPTSAPVTSVTPTPSGNGIATPLPTMPGMVANCDAFYFVQKNENCQVIADKHGISLAQFVNWNTGVGGRQCTGLWAEVNVCVSVVGHTPTSKAPTPTPTPSPTGCTTAHPEPTQPGSLCSCKQWYLPQTGEYCYDIQQKFKISAAQFNAWNPSVGSGCGGLWKDTYVCVKN